MTRSFDRRSRSLWMDIEVAPGTRQLEKDQSCDTIVIGSGIAGLSTAYELAREGQKVIVVDRGSIAGGITARTSAHLKPGHGAIVRQGLSKIAAYRDESGELYTHSAACTHLGCHLHWNSFECCWDCHGSHFAVDGTALNAPAVSALAKAG